ncbi:MAG: MmgE/PrpD family protein [Peptococcaceae bacterium]|nr:MmgE/PrpD family protein [Peptococcaceae bacterium]MDH7523900.1 MmgE/PrpD family protein [Peptococcaceae bacterium]
MDDPGMSLSEKLAGFVAGTDFDDIPANIASYTKERVLDIMAACIAGSRGWEYGAELVKGLKDVAMGFSTVIGRSERLSCPAAAMVNSAFGHAVELDDGHKNAGVHAGTVVVPAALAVGEALRSTGKDVLASIVLGYDIVYRIARSVNPAQIKKGFHPSATCGTFGAAAAAASLLGLDDKQTAAALGLSGMQAAGLMEATLSGQASKCVMVGHAAFAGIVSAWLAKEGLVGPRSILEGQYGIFNTMSEEVDCVSAAGDLGKRFEIVDTYTKLYPTCRHIHPVIESIAALKEECGFSAEDVSRVAVGTHEVAMNLTGHIYEPEDSARARFSIPFISAVVLREGSVGMRHLEPRYLSDPDLKKTARLVEVTVDEEVNRMFPGKRGARVEVFLKDGTRLEKTIYVLKGSPEMPVGWDIICQKFFECASGLMPEKNIFRLVEAIERIEELEDVSRLMELLVN